MKNIFLVCGVLVFAISCSKTPGELTSVTGNNGDAAISVTKNNVAADNYSYAEISVVAKNIPSSNGTITFTCDKGLFSNNSTTYTVTVSITDTTKAYIKCNSADLVRVTAKVFNQYSKDVFVSFILAKPSQILIYPDSVSLQPVLTSKSLIKAKLLRPTGSVTQGQYLNYYDSTAASGASIGSFLNSTLSDANGNSTVEYWLQNTSYHGFVYIKGYILSDTGKVFGINKILIQ